MIDEIGGKKLLATLKVPCKMTFTHFNVAQLSIYL